MAGLPKLPGINFSDPTVSRFHLSHSFDLLNGYKVPRQRICGIGGKEIDVNTVGYFSSNDPVRYDPSLTYGRTRSVAQPQFMPHYALYDQKCLTFNAFFKQSVYESPSEFYRVRQVNIIYFLEDDSITVMEPKIPNSGLDQGRLIRRGKIPKTEAGDYWHWKDLAVGKDIAFYGTVFHMVDCDLFTREYMASQGLTMGGPEQMPHDPYTFQRQMEVQVHVTKTPPADDKLRRFLEYDGKILNFEAVWDTRDAEYGELRPFKILYFLADDTISVKEVHERNSGRDPFPLLLRKTKLPKVWTDRPVTFPSIYLELSDAEVTEYYQPRDLLVGDTIFVLGRRMLLVDCDAFSRNYYRKVLSIEQKPAIPYQDLKKPDTVRPMPPHNGIGSLEDSLQNTLTFLPKPPKKDVIRQVLNANKNLRYEMMMDVVHPEDSIRRFLLRYSLADGTCNIHEPPIRNSGIIGGKFLRNSLICKPGTNPLNPDYYTPADFYIGAVITVFEQRFVIIGADLYVYRYMQDNSEKFPCEVIENIRNFMYNKGYLTEDVKNQVEQTMAADKKAQIDAIGKELSATQKEIAECMKDLKAGGENFDPEYEKAKQAQLLEEYEKTLIPTYTVPPHGILPVNNECAYPVYTGIIPSTKCPEDVTGTDTYTPKHIDTPEEIKQKYYANILSKTRDICERGKPMECEEQPIIAHTECLEKPPSRPEPLMVSPEEYPNVKCVRKAVRFAEGPDRCLRDRHDLCNLKTDKTTCDCTKYLRNCK